LLIIKPGDWTHTFKKETSIEPLGYGATLDGIAYMEMNPRTDGRI